jgi:CCR4-NOT complex subunit CAF16
MGLLRPWKVLLLDEVTTDLDVLVRSELLDFLRCETESRDCTIVYCTHIFDGLAAWPTHLLKMSLGRVTAFNDIMEIVGRWKGDSANSALYEVCLAWLREDKLERGRRGEERRKRWIDLPEEVRGPIIEPDASTAATRVERWRLQPSIRDT